MSISEQDLITRLPDEDTSTDEDEAEYFYELRSAVKQHHLRRINGVFEHVSNITNLITKKDKNQNDNTFLHIALNNIKKTTDHQQVIEVINCLIENGVPVDVENDNHETPLDLIEKHSKKVTTFEWDALKTIIQLEQRKINGINDYNLVQKPVQRQINSNQAALDHTTLTERRMPEFYDSSQGAKRSLHGYTYQLKIIMLFVQRIPDGQNFSMATEIDKAHKFDDVVLRYEEDGVRKYIFVQVKHKHEEAYEIKLRDLFKINGKQKSDTRYFISEYYKSFCNIAKEEIFNDGIKEQFLLCTNIDFCKYAKSFFERIEDHNDFIWGYPTTKYKLNNEKKKEIRELLEISDTNENIFLEFMEKFRFVVRFRDNTIHYLIQETFPEYLKIKNTDFAIAYVQERLLNWFQSYRNNQSTFLRIEDKNGFLKSLNNNVRSLLVAGYSSFYIEELQRYGIKFKNPLPGLKRVLSDKVGLFVLVTFSPKISTIKICQIIIEELKLLKDEVIFLSSNNLETHEQLIDTFYDDRVYKFLVIECDRGKKIDRIILDKVIKASQAKNTNAKKILIVGQKEDVENIDGEHVHDIGSSFETLDEVTQIQLLTRLVIFQGRKVRLDQLINIYSAKKIIDDLILEELLLIDEIKIGNELKLPIVEDYYIFRTLVKKYIEPRIFQDEKVLKKSCFFISGINKQILEQFHVEHKWISEWKGNSTVLNGIILLPEKFLNDATILRLHQYQENLYWIEYKNGKFVFKENNKCVLNIPDTGLKEGDLCKEEILDNKITIITGDPGLGKTTYIQRAAYNFKKTMSDIWVLQIDLKSYLSNKRKSLKDISFMETDVHAAIEFLADICLPSNYENSKNTISRKILVESLQVNNQPENKYSKIIIFFDGFDEISSNFKKQTLKLLQALKGSNVKQIWITTRTCEETSLEIALGSFALRLKPISEEEKQGFVIKFWEHKLKMEQKNNNKSILLKFSAERLFRDFNHYDLWDFTDNPLHLKMLAEVTYKNIISLEKFGEWKNMTLPFLYKEFLNIKTNEIYWIDKRPEDNPLQGQDWFEWTLGHLRKYLQEISYTILFSPHNIEFKDFSDIYLATLAKRIGLVITYNDQLQFVHQSFAECFVCDYFVENFENIPSIIFEVLSDNNYQLIRTFLNGNEGFLQKLSSQPNCLISVISQTGKYSYLYKMAKEQNYNFIINHLRNIPCDLSEKIILFSTNDKKETILHLICREVGDEEMFINLFNSIRKSISDITLKKLLSKKNEKKQTVFNSIINTSFYELSNKKFRIILDVLKDQPEMICQLISQVDYLGNTVLHEACQQSLDQIVIFILESVKNNPKILKDLLMKTDKRGQISLHCVFLNKYVYSPERILSTFQNVLNFSKHALGPKFCCKMMLHVDCEGNTALHLAFKMRESVPVKYLLEQLKETPDILKRLLLKINTDGQSVLHCIFPTDFQCYFSDALIDRLKEIINFVTTYLNATVLYELLLQSDKNGNTILNLACITASDKCVSYLLKAVEGNREVSKAFLLKLNKHHQNILHSILLDVNNKNQKNMILILKEILQLINIQLSSEILYNLLLQVDYQGNTSLHFAFMSWSYDGATYILDAVKDNFPLAKKLVLTVNKKGQNIIHCIFVTDQYYQQVFDKRSFILNIFLDMVTFPFNSDVLLSLLLQDDYEGNTSLHLACMAHSVRCVYSLTELIKDNPEILLTKYLLRINSKGQNILHCIFITNSSPFETFDAENVIICSLVDFIKCNIEYDVLKILLLQTDNEGNTVLHLASMVRSDKCLISLLEAGNDNNILKELLLKTNLNGQNLLHCILFSHYYFFVSDKYDKVKLKIHKVIDFITNYYNFNLLYDLLLQADNEGNTTLHIACKIRANKVVSDILDAIRGNHEVVSKLLIKKNLQGQTALHYILLLIDFDCFNLVPLTLQEIVDFLNHYDSKILHDLLLQTDNRGYTALHYACALRSNQGVSLLIEAVRSNTEVLNELILKTNYYNENAIHCTILIYVVDALYLDIKIIGTDTTKNLLELVKCYCDSEVLKKLFLQTDKKKHTALHMACQRISDETALCKRKQVSIKSNGDVAYESNYFKRPYISRLNILLDFMNVVCPEILSEVVCNRCDMGTVLHIICNGIYNLDEEDNNEWEEESQEEEEGDKEEHLAQSIKLDMLLYLLETIKDDIELLNRLLLTTDNHGQTALHYTIYKFENPDMFKLLFNFVQVNCSGEILRELLYKADDNDCTILHLACNGNKEILMCVVNALEGMNEPLGDLFLKKDKWKQNALENALRNFGRENIPQQSLELWNNHTNIENGV